MRTGSSPRFVLGALAGALIAACGATSTAITPATRVSPTPVPTATPSATAAPTPNPTSSVPITKLLTKCPAPRAFSSLPRFSSVSGAGSVATAPDGTVWVSAGSRGVIVHLSATGSVMVSYNEPTPGGIVVLPSGDVLFADQGADRVDELDPSTLAVSTFLQLTPRAGQPNVDGLGVDTANSLLLVPDQAQGQVLTVPLAGGSPTTLSGGIGRPIDAAVGPGGAIEIATPTNTGLMSAPAAGGAATKSNGLSLPLSAVVVKGLLVYATAPAAHRVYAYNPATGHNAVLVTAIGNPQGIALLPDGQLVVSDATTGTLATFNSC
jgi:hypothetical protein